MANGRWMPRRSRAVTSGWGRPSWWNVGPVGSAGASTVFSAVVFSDGGVLSGVLDRRSTRTRQGGPKSCGVGLRYSSERVPWKRKAPAVPASYWRSLRPGVERGICTDALMPGQTVREDDRPMCRYA